ncbi:hypothetical protein [Porphyromonas levii]|uniref:hypothetical protein n=1 Tax=Porphyromonas levii TaxID=28114 RepID=UPI00201165C9|nr:hypothetical protein [Porphyromonas levii]MBR8766286.1 hypothetical protein [Porphyromonas levii]MBR8803543.1 hypothetical protein [Porphyromonas levii]
METLTVVTMIVTAITAILGIVFSSLSLRQNYELNKKKKLDSLQDGLNHLLGIAVEYPYLEHQPFIDKWMERKGTNEEYLRYDIYCNLLFNFLAELYEFYEGDKTKIEKFCDIKTWVRMHKLNWEHPIDPNENIDGYSDDFRNFINSYIQ